MKTYKMYSEETKQIEDFTMIELCEIAAKEAKRICKRMKTSERKEVLKTQLEIVFINASAPLRFIPCNEEKPAKGAAFSVIEMKDRFRINYRCGYSKHNYAPCVEVEKEKEKYKHVKNCDVVFNDETSSSAKGFSITLNEAKAYIDFNRNTDNSYFTDYKGGTVSVVCNETGSILYSEKIK